MSQLSSPVDYKALIEPTRVHSRLYYDEAIFKEELEKIWYRTWVYVGHTSEIPKRGDYKTTKVGRNSVIGASASVYESVPPNTVVTLEKPTLRMRQAS